MKKTKVVMLKMSDFEFQMLKRQSENHHTNVSEYLRGLIYEKEGEGWKNGLLRFKKEGVIE